MITQIETNYIGNTLGAYINEYHHSFKDRVLYFLTHRNQLKSMSQCIQKTTNKHFYVYSEIHHSNENRMMNRVDSLVKLKLAHFMDDLISSHT